MQISNDLVFILSRSTHNCISSLWARRMMVGYAVAHPPYLLRTIRTSSKCQICAILCGSHRRTLSH